MVIPVNSLQYENAPWPMVVMLLGKVMLVRFSQYLNALVPILVTLFGIIMLVNPLLQNVSSAILVKLFEREIVVNPEQRSKPQFLCLTHYLE